MINNYTFNDEHFTNHEKIMSLLLVYHLYLMINILDKYMINNGKFNAIKILIIRKYHDFIPISQLIHTYLS
jgi:hypothetical protein